ncbi:hypothetical protein KO465_00425 [Candidatus Micrarchaeota archaeon]|jgi:DNA repair exonuclease SbcCD ATPase subunit|nr:hypothetical protein [Candidatus Micrarchaeota archaeon]
MGNNKDDIDDLLISTSVDALIKYIHSKKRVEIETAANDLNLPFKTVEEWSKALEKQGLIKIEYKFTKEFLIWAGDEEQIVEKIGNIETQKKFSEEKVGQLMNKIKTANAELELLKTQYTRSIADTQPIINETSEKVKELNNLINSSQKLYKKNVIQLNKLNANYTLLQEKSDEIKKELEEFKKSVKETPKNTKVQKVLEEFENKLKKQQTEIDKKLKDIETKIQGQRKKLEDVDNIKISFERIGAEIEKNEAEQHLLKEMIGEVGTTYTDFIKTSKRIAGGMPFNKKITLYKQEIDKVNKTLEQVERKVQMMRAEIDEGKISADTVLMLHKKIATIDFKDNLGKMKEREKQLNEDVKSLKDLYGEVKSSENILEEVKNSIKEIDAAERLIKTERVKVTDLISKMSDTIKEDIRELSVYDTRLDRIANRTNILVTTLEKQIKDHEKFVDGFESEKEAFKKDVASKRVDVKNYIQQLEQWDKKYREVSTKKTFVSKITKTIDGIRTDTKELEDNIEIIKKKIDLLAQLKNKPEEQYAVLKFIEGKLQETKEKEKNVESKRKELNDLIEKMWKNEKESSST